MEREIKFRQAIFRDGLFHHWHYWGYVGYQNDFVAPITIGQQSWNKTYGIKPSQQYTGRMDESGAEIYEGDTVKTIGGHSGRVFDRLGCWFVEMGKELGYYNELVQIIGKAYESGEQR